MCKNIKCEFCKNNKGDTLCDVRFGFFRNATLWCHFMDCKVISGNVIGIFKREIIHFQLSGSKREGDRHAVSRYAMTYTWVGDCTTPDGYMMWPQALHLRALFLKFHFDHTSLREVRNESWLGGGSLRVFFAYNDSGKVLSSWFLMFFLAQAHLDFFAL